MATGKKLGIRLFIWRKFPGSWSQVPSLNPSHQILKHKFEFLLYLHQFYCCLCIPQSPQQQKKKGYGTGHSRDPLSGTRLAKAYCTCIYTQTHSRTQTYKLPVCFWTMQTLYLDRATLIMIPVQRGTATSPCTLFRVRPSCTDEAQVTGVRTSSEQVAFTPDGKEKLIKEKESQNRRC